MQKIKFNRVFIIGNGFDKAHGVKTGYDDFLLWYLKNVMYNTLNEDFDKSKKYREYKDELTTCRCFYDDYCLDQQKQEIDNKQSLSELYDSNHFIFNESFSLADESGEIKDKEIYFKFIFKTSFLKKLLNDNNWSDIESFYFAELIWYYENEKSSKNNDFSSVKRLNKDLKLIKEKLVEYLSSLQSYSENPKIYNLLDLYTNEIKYKYLEEHKLTDGDLNINFGNIGNEGTPDVETTNLILNFNYTNYYKKIYNDNLLSHKPSRRKIINIHGVFSMPETVIFGYGDDSHKKYNELEQNGCDDLISNIKSFEYPFKRSYREVLNFINQKIDFEVITLGHSLGLSDRVLLKSIFENKYCKKIRICHRGKESFKRKIMALSRHFDNKISFRDKVIEYNEDDIM